MLTAPIHLVDVIRSMWSKLAQNVRVVVECFHEAQEFRRKTPRIHVDD